MSYTSSPSLDLITPLYLEDLSLLILGIHNTCLYASYIPNSTSTTEDFKRRILQPYF